MSEEALTEGLSPPRTRKGAATRGRLMAAASRLFSEHGYDGTSVEAIATAAGITVPGMYRHFPNKASILMEVARSATITSAARRALADGPDLPRRLGALFAEYTAVGQIERRRLSIELSRASYQNDELRAELVNYNAVLRAALQETLETARPVLGPGGESELLAHLLLLLLMGAIHLDTLDADLIGDSELVEFIVGRLTVMLDDPGTDDGPPSPQPVSLESLTARGTARPESEDGRHRRSARTRSRILSAASELFAVHGYDGTTLEMIASKAQITVPGLYLHVTSKEGLLVEVGQQTFTGYRMSRPVGEGRDPLGFLSDLACAYSGSADFVARRLAIELDFGAWRNPALAEGLRHAHQAVRSNVADSLQPRGSSDRERDLSAVLVLMLFMGIAHVDTVDPSLMDDPRWCGFLRRRIPQLTA